MKQVVRAGVTPGATSPTPPSRGRRDSRSSWWPRFDRRFTPYAFIAPFFLLFAVFGLYPMAYTFWISLTDRTPFGSESNFIGLDNYAELLGDSAFWNALWNTLGLFVVSSVPQLLMALVLASWLSRRVRGIGFFRTSAALPIVTSTAVVALVFGMIFARDYGLANWLLDAIGFEPIDWRASRWASWTAIATMVDWRWTGYNALIFLAGMQAIPNDLYEAAAIDGASRFQQFWRITVPLLRPTIVFVVLVSTIGGLQLFTEPVMFTSGSGALGGGSVGQYQTLTMYLVENMRTFNLWGYAGAVAWLLFVLTVIVSLVNFLLVRRLSPED